MAGIDAVSGAVLDELADIRQSLRDILTTPVGTRVMRRDYGSHIFDLIDAPGTDAGALQMVAAAADAIDRWEKRVTLKSAKLVPAFDGSAVLSLTAAVRASALTITADVRLGGAS